MNLCTLSETCCYESWRHCRSVRSKSAWATLTCKDNLLKCKTQPSFFSLKHSQKLLIQVGTLSSYLSKHVHDSNPRRLMHQIISNIILHFVIIDRFIFPGETPLPSHTLPVYVIAPVTAFVFVTSLVALVLLVRRRTTRLSSNKTGAIRAADAMVDNPFYSARDTQSG